MMTHQLEVSILAAPLGAIDRRALSQAWYSALRFAPQSPQLQHQPSFDRGGMQAYRGALRSVAPQSSRATSPGMLRSQAIKSKRAANACGRDGAAGARNGASRARLAERIERTFGSPATNLKRATFSLGPGSARVHVVMQTAGARTTLLAICRPELRQVVARALAQARAALAARGIGVEFCAIGSVECL
jgi:hypothetical protein